MIANQSEFFASSFVKIRSKPAVVGGLARYLESQK
jgi:hypothetical protein